MKIIVSVCLLIALCSSCSTKDAAFCECMSAGEELNNYAQDLLEGDVTEVEATKLKGLRTKKDEACKAYETMDGPTMLEKKEACEK